jgi:8-hydroxy-5-deazaflavin:NADPH oxidoreductase
MKQYAVLGTGAVGKVLAAGLKKHGYKVSVGTRTPSKMAEWVSANPGIDVVSLQKAVATADVVILAVKGDAAEEALKLCGNLEGKIIIDTTNPIAPLPPEHGVLKFFTDLNLSLMEQLQQRFSEAKFVKSFSCVGNLQMVNPHFEEGKPTMFICGNDASAKSEVASLLDKFGWDVEDLGDAEAARAIEPLCILWCIPGFLKGQWTHALKLLRK